MAANNLKTKDVNLEMGTKVGGQMEDSGLEKKASGQMENSMLATDIIIKTHGKLRDHEKETLKKMADDVKANGIPIVPRLQETSSEKISTTGLSSRWSTT